MIHRDLSNQTHQTNLHLHYKLPYREEKADDDSRSFFSYGPESPVRFTPKDPEVHKPLSIKQVLERRLSWVTLGGQYNWTEREYPDQEPPRFPEDIAGFLQTLFPETIAQAAIVNFYTPGDTMMMHRDVSEQTDKGLVSLSIGCDALFMIAPNEYGKTEAENKENGAAKKPYLLLRLRSGDAIYMSEESRYAWHGVPKVLKGTCPEALADWPAEDGNFEEWRGWMRNKRINLNVRQMK
jgi:DNA alkylation damage repair protein AlkB